MKSRQFLNNWKEYNSLEKENCVKLGIAKCKILTHENLIWNPEKSLDDIYDWFGRSYQKPFKSRFNISTILKADKPLVDEKLAEGLQLLLENGLDAGFFRYWLKNILY